MLGFKSKSAILLKTRDLLNLEKRLSQIELFIKPGADLKTDWETVNEIKTEPNRDADLTSAW